MISYATIFRQIELGGASLEYLYNNSVKRALMFLRGSKIMRLIEKEQGGGDTLFNIYYDLMVQI